MSKEPLKKMTFSLEYSEWLKQNMPLSGWKLIKYKQTWYGLHILTFEKTHTNG